MPEVRPCLGGLLLTGRFDLSSFDITLFEGLGIPFPARLERAVPKRRAEFLAGRVMARVAQEALGRDALPVGVADSRAPIWPDGLRGSISHARGFCAVLALPEGLGDPGVDIEAIASGNALASIEQITLKGADRELLREAALPFAAAATLCFSAKETLYKALYPTVGTFFGFDAAEVASAPSADRIRLRLTRGLAPGLRRGMVFDIGAQMAADHVLTWLRHPA